LSSNTFPALQADKEFQIMHHQKRLSFSSQPSGSPASSPSPASPWHGLAVKADTASPSSPSSSVRGGSIVGVGFADEQVEQLESNCACLKEQEDRLGEEHKVSPERLSCSCPEKYSA